jgi:penicillin amidase
LIPNLSPRRLLFRAVTGKRLPVTSGTLHVDGPRRPLTIHRDNYGIPHIEATTDEDAWFGLGFAQAQDRAFQLELRMRTARGTLSEVIGAPTLNIDRLSRRIGFHESSRRQLPVMAPEVRAQIEAFVAGINAAYAAGLPKRPHEFLLLRSKPTPWEATDVLSAGKLMSFWLIGNWDVELSRLKVLLSDGEQALRDLDPEYQAHHPVSTPPGAEAGPMVDRLSADLEEFRSFAGGGTGSNNWAISGSKTKSGRPILANDPHLDPVLPAHWYLCHLSTPDWQLAGAALLGAPAIGAGHNGHVAWGITAGLTDTVDLFIEDVAPDGRGVQRGGGYERCELRQEVIRVKGKPAVTEEVLVTPRGPVVSPGFTDNLPVLSMRAVWLDPRPARGFLTVHKTQTVEEFRRQFEQWPVLPQNVAVADTSGTIAWQLVGELPRRRKGYGTMPLHGADAETGWYEDTVPFTQMPFALDPDIGFVASANNKPVSDAWPGPFLGVDWLDGYRVGRIFEALGQRDDWDVASTQRLQLDEVSMTWREIRDAVLAIEPHSEEARFGVELLRAWDGVVAVTSGAASVYEGFIGEMWQRVAASRAPSGMEYALGRGFTELLPGSTFAAGRISTLLRRINEQPEGWLDQPWSAVMSEALAAVVAKLRREHGAAPSGWAWGTLRQLTLQHPVGRINQLSAIFNRGPFPFGGDGNTVSQASASIRRFGANPGAIASLRAVIDVGDWDASRFSLPGGQSGNPLSPHYDDQLPLWLKGEGVPIAWTPEAVRGAIKTSLRLVPLDGAARAPLRP